MHLKEENVLQVLAKPDFSEAIDLANNHVVSHSDMVNYIHSVGIYNY